MAARTGGRGNGVDIGALEEKYLYLIDMKGLRAKDGGKILGAKAWYHVVKAPK